MRSGLDSDSAAKAAIIGAEAGLRISDRSMNPAAGDVRRITFGPHSEAEPSCAASAIAPDDG